MARRVLSPEEVEAEGVGPSYDPKSGTGKVFNPGSGLTEMRVGYRLVGPSEEGDVATGRRRRVLSAEEAAAEGVPAPRTIRDEDQEREARASADPGVFATIGHQALRGFFKGNSDELAGKIRGAVTGEKGAGAARRDQEREILAASDRHRPKLSFLSNIAGEVGSDLTGAALGVPLLSRGGLVGSGLVRGYGESTSEDAGEQLLDAGVGGVVGYGAHLLPKAPGAIREGVRKAGQAIEGTALGGRFAGSAMAKSFKEGADALGGAVSSAASRVAKPVGEAIEAVARWPGEALDRAGIATGRRVLTAGQGSLSGKAALSDDAVREAMDSGAIVPFGTVRGASNRLTKVRDTVGDEYEGIIRELEERGVRGPEAKTLADRWMDRFRAEFSESGSSKTVPKVFKKEAANVERITRPAPGVEGPAAERLGLSQAEGLKRSLQKDAKYGDYKDTLINDAKKEVAADVRGAIENEVRTAAAGTSDPALRGLAARFEPVKKRLSNIIPADDAAFRGAEQAKKANLLSLRDTIVGAAGLSAAGGATMGVKGALAAVPLAVGTHLARTRGPSTFAWGSRAAAKLYLDAIDSAPWLFGDLGAAVAREKTPEARLAVTEALAMTNARFAEALEDFKQKMASRQEPSAPEATRAPR